MTADPAGLSSARADPTHLGGSSVAEWELDLVLILAAEAAAPRGGGAGPAEMPAASTGAEAAAAARGPQSPAPQLQAVGPSSPVVAAAAEAAAEAAAPPALAPGVVVQGPLALSHRPRRLPASAAVASPLPAEATGSAALGGSSIALCRPRRLPASSPQPPGGLRPTTAPALPPAARRPRRPQAPLSFNQIAWTCDASVVSRYFGFTKILPLSF